MKIAIVTFEFEGLTKNGGIGTAFRRLGELLLDAGHSVTIVLTPFGVLQRNLEERDQETMKKIAALHNRGFHVVTPDLPSRENASLRGMSYHLRRSLLVYRFLKQTHFDVVHTTDNCGLTYFSLLAKKQGLALARTVFVMGAHGSTLWTQEANGSYTVGGLALAEIDRRSMGLSDIVVSPSQYMVNDLRRRKWHLPRLIQVIPNVNQVGRQVGRRVFPPRDSVEPVGAQKKLVFFGRLERRKGIFLFIDAVCGLLDAEPALGEKQPLEIIFLGRDEPLRNRNTSDYLRERLAPYGKRVSCHFKPDCSSEESLDFLSQDQSYLICMPSLIDNSPYVVLEAVERGFDFLSSGSGGQAELIHPEDRKAVLFAPKTESLKAVLRKRLYAPKVRVRPSSLASSANKKWLDFHEKIAKGMRRRRPSPDKLRLPEVSVIVGRPRQSGADGPLIDSLFRQDYPNLKIYLPSGTSVKPPRRNRRCAYYDVALVDRHHHLVSKVAAGEYVLFLSSGEIHDAKTISRLVQAAKRVEGDRTFAGLLGLEGTYAKRGKTPRRTVTWSVSHVCHGWAGALTERIQPRFALWRRNELVKHLDKGRRDWDTRSANLFSKLLLAGKNVELFPEPVILAPHAPLSVDELADPLNGVRPFLNRRGNASQWTKVVLLSVLSSEECREAQDKLAFRLTQFTQFIGEEI